MPTEVLMPQLGESVVEGTITRWLKNVGDSVEEYEPLLEVNTDKVDTEIPSPATGVVLKILVEENTTVEAGVTLCWIGEAGEVAPAAGSATTASKTESTPTPSTSPIPDPVSAPAAPSAGRSRDLGFISPVVARMAGEHNLDLYQITGTGKGGRITKKDVLAYIEKQKEAPAPAVVKAPSPMPIPQVPASTPPPPAPRPAVSPPSSGNVVPLSPMRRAIAQHMVHSKHTSPHVTTVMEADLSSVVGHRARNKATFARDGAKLTFTPYFVAATVSALKAFPIVNSSWRDDGILYHPQINIGMATAITDGLIVPVIKGADGYSLLGLSRTVNDLSARARDGRLSPDEVTSGTFTITNHGVSGSLFATPIINQPQCAILGVGAIQKRVVVTPDNAIAIRPMVYLSLTFDHRILDGATADHFLANIVETLQVWI